MFTESLCPDSTRFYKKAFKKFIETPDILDICDFNIYPFGKFYYLFTAIYDL